MKINYFFFILFFLYGLLRAQHRELPPFKNYPPKEYAAGNQNWDIDQGADGHIYFANNTGLLEFNGAQWQLYPSPNQSIIRSVEVIGDKIYTGCYMDFGFWQRDGKGLLSYTSLSKKANVGLVEDEQFWNILAVEHWILFQSLNRIYLYDTQTGDLDLIDLDVPLTKSFNVDGTVYFQASGKGLYRIKKGRTELVNSAPVLCSDVLVHMMPFGEKILLVTQNNGLFDLDEKGIAPAVLPIDKVLGGKAVYSVHPLKNGNIMFGTIADGLYIMDGKGEVKLRLNQGEGLLNNTVLSLYQDRDDNIWLGLDNGISVVNRSTAFSSYQDNTGKLGTVYTSLVTDAMVYLGTNQGLFYRARGADGDFELMSGTRGQVWALKSINGTVFCGHNRGTYVVTGDSARLISDIPGAWDFKLIPNMQDGILLGTYSGLYVIDKTGEDWGVKNKLSGFDISSRYFEITSQNNILVSHEYKGVFLLKTVPGFKKIKSFKLLGLPSAGFRSGLVKYRDTIFYISQQGAYAYRKDQGFVRDNFMSQELTGKTNYVSGKTFWDQNNDRLWGFTGNGLLYFSPRDLDGRPSVAHVSYPASLRRGMKGFENISAFNDEKYMVGTVNGYTVIDLDKMNPKNYKIELDAVLKGGRDGLFENIILEPEQKDFDANENNFGFRFSVAEYDIYRTVEYQYRLKGIYDDWNAWAPKSEAFFENLPFGDYQFEVRARVGGQISQNTVKYNFTVARPWYVSIAAFVVYALFIMVIIGLIQFYNRRYYKRQKKALIIKNQKELDLARIKGEGEIMKMKNEQLQNDFKNKSRQLAASAMNIVKKNELLNAIKKDLMPAIEDPQVKAVVHTIDKNLGDKKDWKFFEEAFNNADKDFLKTIKELHPELTPNDLKLCAYLRLNLSSKEIAPLLNISVRSIETKRYRLRKKMNLEHDDGLVEYILSI